MSPNYINDLIEVLGTKDFSVNVISKSGTTTEPAIAFRIFREMLENRYGIEEARSRIYVTTLSLSVVTYILLLASSIPYLFSNISLNILNAIAGSVVVPDFDITFTEKSFVPSNSIKSFM